MADHYRKRQYGFERYKKGKKKRRKNRYRMQLILTPCMRFQGCRGMVMPPGGGINYVVAQAGDNDYYLHRLLNGAEAKAGTLFMDYQNHSDFSDWNTMIYGHHMKNGTMFASLVKYQDQEYYEKHPVMYLYTPGQRMKLEILAGYTTDIEDSVYTIPTTKEGRDELVKHVLQKSNFTSKASVTGEDKLVTLSTCTYEYENARFVVIGKIAE